LKPSQDTLSLTPHPQLSVIPQDWERDTKARIKAGKFRCTKPMQKKSLSELIDRYVEDAVGHHRAAADTKRHLAYFKETLGDYALVHLTPELLLKERKKLVDTPTYRGTPRNAATVNRYMSSLSGALRYAYKNLRWIDENPCASILKLKEEPKTRRTLTLDEEARLLEACRQSKNKYLFCITLIALTTGARQGEILALTWDCIDFEHEIAHIKDSKNGRPRRVALVPTVIRELRSLQATRDPFKPLVFASRSTFGKIDPKKAWQRALEEAAIEDFVFHGLRHHFASFGGQIGATGVQLRSQLGHSSSAMTDHYAHSDAEATRFIGERIEKRILGEVSNG
jgi:integrase